VRQPPVISRRFRQLIQPEAIKERRIAPQRCRNCFRTRPERSNKSASTAPTTSGDAMTRSIAMGRERPSRRFRIPPN